jgi:ATP-dependent DNA helicase RecQ
MALRRRLLENTEGITPSVLEHKWNLFLELMRWVEGGSCRHDAILRYFGDEAETLAGCGRCDVCETLGGRELTQDPEATTLIVRKALSAVARVHDRFGITAAVQLLRGAEDPRLQRAGLDRTTTFGVLREHGPDWLLKVLRRCVTAGWVEFTAGDRPVVRLTEAGRAVMRAERPAALLLPGTTPRPRDIVGRTSRTRAASFPGEAPGRGARAAPGLSRSPADTPGALAVDPAAAAIFEGLRQHRLKAAREQGVAPFVIASDRTLREIAALRPRTISDLYAIYGIGRAKAEKYGQAFLDIVAREGTVP